MFYISFYLHSAYSAAAAAQRIKSLDDTKSRGIIYDKNLARLTGEATLGAQIAPHLIGYVNTDGDGLGLEKALDDFLSNVRPASYFERSASGEVMVGVGAVVSPSSRRGVITTIDYKIQKIAQDALENANVSGAAVVIKAKTNEILAMASTPAFSKEDIEKNLNSSGGEFLNRAILSYDVGSVFKIVTLAAGLEEKITSGKDIYYCNGHKDILGFTFYCQRLSGHGEIGLPRAFAVSCNMPFYDIGEKLGTARLAEYAEKFGFGQKAIVDVDLGESAGEIGAGEDLASFANLSIGQGAFCANTLQVANMISTVVNQGVRRDLKLIAGEVGEDGEVQEREISQNAAQIISSKNAQIIKDFMIEVVESGSGTAASLEGVGAGGKTASAESGWEGEAGETMVQAWFGGFFPKDNPEYICVVLVEDGKRGGETAAPIFKTIGDAIINN
jgi:cell division protein FtsI/penicillin-binding protein 2